MSRPIRKQALMTMAVVDYEFDLSDWGSLNQFQTAGYSAPSTCAVTLGYEF